MEPVELLCGVRYVAWRACREGADVRCGHSCESQLLFGAVVLQFPDFLFNGMFRSPISN